VKQLIHNYRNGKLELVEIPLTSCRDFGLLVRNVVSVISVGTEKMMLELAQKSLVGKALARPDLFNRLINKATKEGLIKTFSNVLNIMDSPAPLGYSCAGEVIAVGKNVDDFNVGDRVACMGSGFASHAEVVFIPNQLCVKIPDGVDFEEAGFGSIGAIALNGVRSANIAVGEKVAVIGLGLLGLLTVQILKASGCKVIGADVDPSKINLAKQCGLDEGVDPAHLSSEFMGLTGGTGVDAVIITAASETSETITLATTITRFRGRIVLVGVAKIEISRQLFWEKELSFTVSKGRGPGFNDHVFELQGIDYPMGYVRWTERRNLESFLGLVCAGKISIKPLITHRFKIEQIVHAYEKLLEGKERHIGVVIEYDASAVKTDKVIITDKLSIISRCEIPQIGLGVVGGGLFAKNVLLPAVKRLAYIRCEGIVSATGMNAYYAAKKFGFRYCSTDTNELLSDNAIQAVIIATRHNLHARLTIEALKKGKVVFVEKPLAVNLAELQEIMSVMKDSGGRLMVGYNRRFSPLSIKAKEFFNQTKEPMVINYRVNAGFIPNRHWVHDEEGGGRIIGEVCHFIDFLQFITSSNPVQVYAQRIQSSNEEVRNSDNVIISITMSNGSVASLIYTAGGDRTYPKEFIEIFSDKSVCVIDDFRSAMFVRNGKKKCIKASGQEMGHSQELKIFFDSIRQGWKMPVSIEDYAATTLATFNILESLMQNKPMTVKF